MAIEKVVEIKVVSNEAKKNITDINSVIDEQRAILVLLEEEYLKAKKALDDYNASGKVNLAQEKALKKTLSERKDALTDQKLGLKKLAIEQRESNRLAKEFRNEQKETTNIIRGIDKLTGGFATKIVKLTKGFKSGVKGIKGFITGLSGVKKALIATGIGALVVLVGTLVANFDKIKSVLFGISKQSKAAAESAKDSADASQSQLENLEGSENILRAQGKSEKEIRDLKKQQTDETIKSLEAQLVAQKTIRDEQIKTANRNKTILTGILNFLLTPITSITKSIDSIGKKFGKDFGLTEAVGSATSSLSGALFSGIDKEGDKAIEETEKILLRLKNKKAGFIVQEIKEEDDRKKKAKEKAEKEAEEAAEEEKSRLESIQAIRDEFAAKQEDLELNNELEKINLEEQRALDELNRLEATEEQKTEVIAFYNKKRLKNDELIKDARSKLQLQFVSEVGNAIGALGSLFDEGTTAAKGAALADIIIKTGVGFAQGLDIAQKSAAGTGPAAAFAFPIFYAQQIASVLGAVGQARNILKKVKGGSGGTTSTGGGTISTPQATPAPPQFNIVGSSDTNQLADAVAGQTQQPVQAFVV